MKAYFIISFENHDSKRVGEEHLALVKKYGDFQPTPFIATTGDQAFAFLETAGLEFLRRELWPTEFSRLMATRKEDAYNKKKGIAGCFCSHYRLWQECVKLNEPIGIFEYDAKQVKNMPQVEFNDFLYLSAWRNWEGDSDKYYEYIGAPGLHPYEGYDKWGFKNVVSGTHAYLLKPHTAQHFIDTAHLKGWFPVDRFF